LPHPSAYREKTLLVPGLVLPPYVAPPRFSVYFSPRVSKSPRHGYDWLRTRLFTFVSCFLGGLLRRMFLSHFISKLAHIFQFSLVRIRQSSTFRFPFFPSQTRSCLFSSCLRRYSIFRHPPALLCVPPPPFACLSLILKPFTLWLLRPYTLLCAWAHLVRV